VKDVKEMMLSYEEAWCLVFAFYSKPWMRSLLTNFSIGDIPGSRCRSAY
jgi:hypothetical protein